MSEYKSLWCVCGDRWLSEVYRCEFVVTFCYSHCYIRIIIHVALVRFLLHIINIQQ